jgi:hypothetical protein
MVACRRRVPAAQVGEGASLPARGAVQVGAAPAPVVAVDGEERARVDGAVQVVAAHFGQPVQQRRQRHVGVVFAPFVAGLSGGVRRGLDGQVPGHDDRAGDPGGVSGERWDVCPVYLDLVRSQGCELRREQLEQDSIGDQVSVKLVRRP